MEVKELDFEIESLDEECVYDEEEKPANRYRVTVELIIRADSADDASDDAKLLVDSGVLALLDNEDRSPLASYDVIESEPDEL
jgi:hypothetical protein